MMKFLARHTVALTPLSPIHIGCDEDFEPTNYVIDAEQKLLYGFDPSRADLSEALARRLSDLGQKGNLLGIQKFFRDQEACFKPFAHVLIPVASGVANDYKNKIGKVANLEADGNKVFNQFTIERHIHSRNAPYVPGSSLKGALRTALMDRLNNKYPVTDNEEKKNSAALAKRLLKGDFATSPLRLLKIGDLMPVTDMSRSILYAVNRYKRPKADASKKPRGITARKECILPGQYRALVGEITIQALGDKGISDGKSPNVPRQDMRPDLAQISKDCNAYHLPRLRAELADMDKTGLVNPDWKNAVEKLLKESTLANRLESGQAMLARMGRYGGAESKTLTEVASIKIMGKQGEQPKYLPKTTTYWLAAQTADDQKHMIPFGWGILEVTPQSDLAELKMWCEKEARNRPDMKAKYAALSEEKARVEERAGQQKAEQEAAKKAQRQAEEAAAQAAAKRAEYLVNLSEAGHEVEKFKEECEKCAQRIGSKKSKPYGADYSRAKALAGKARSDGIWSISDRQAAAEAIEYWLPRLEALDAKEVRKKLKLTELKGNT